MRDVPFRLAAPDDMDDVLLAYRLGQVISAAGLERGDRFGYSQMLTEQQVQDAAGWGGLHLVPDGPCTMAVVRQTPKLARGMWAVNLGHLGGGWPTLGRIVSTTAGNWVKLRPYTIHGEPVRTVEPLDARWLARICKPDFPMDGVVRTRNGSFRRIADMGLVPWTPRAEAAAREADDGRGSSAAKLEEDVSVGAWMASDVLLCRSFGIRPEYLYERLGLMLREDAEASEGLDTMKPY